MILSILSLLIAVIIAFGRQVAAFGKVKKALWFFPNYEIKRVWFALLSILFGVLAFLFYDINAAVLALLIIALVLLLLSFVFDFKYIFPEVKEVERSLGKELEINPKTGVIGVLNKGTAVAYPLDVVIPRHIINDKIIDLNIVVSYCAICRSALVFNAEIDGQALYFKVAAVWRRNMVMIDDQTKSLWQQATGVCIYGRHKGKKLELLSGENTNWNAWVNKYPDSEYANKCIEARKGYLTREGMSRGLNYITPKVTPPGYTDLKGLPIRETVFGLSYKGISRAYPISELEGLTTFTDYFNNEKLDFTYDKSSEYLTVVTELEKQIIVEKYWWLGWKEFHPETEIWKKSGQHDK